jgi:hypothetical protein
VVVKPLKRQQPRTVGVDTVPFQNSTPILTFPLQGGRDWEIIYLSDILHR